MVPYIDVMLVLLIIFMVTAPMLMQGVKVDLPEAIMRPGGEPGQRTPIISVDSAGQLFLNVGSQEDQAISLATIKDRVSAVMRRNPGKPVLVWGDRAVPYGEVVTVMVALQEAGAPSVGLVTENRSEYQQFRMLTPVAPRIVLRPALASVCLHALLLFMLTANWADSNEEIIGGLNLHPGDQCRLVDASDSNPSKSAAPNQARSQACAKPALPSPPQTAPPTQTRAGAERPKPRAKPAPKPAACQTPAGTGQNATGAAPPEARRVNWPTWADLARAVAGRGRDRRRRPSAKWRPPMPPSSSRLW